MLTMLTISEVVVLEENAMVGGGGYERSEFTQNESPATCVGT